MNYYMCVCKLMCKNLEYISLLQLCAMLAEHSKMHRNRPLAVHPATVAIIILAIIAIFVACTTLKTPARNAARGNKGKLPFSSNSALTKTLAKARTPRLAKGV